jgi:hypothetical protein
MAKPPEMPPDWPPIQLDDILARVRKERHWSAAEAREAKLWYRRFLWLSLGSERRRIDAISKKADYLWHGHILFTERYRKDCEGVFQRFLDHTPSTGGPQKLTGVGLKRAKALYEKAFGSAPPDIERPCYTPPPRPHGP